MHAELGTHFGWIGFSILLATIAGAVARKRGQSRVLGYLFAGVFVGIIFTGTDLMTALRSQEGIPFISSLAEIAAMLLVFRFGLEANLRSMLEDARTSWKVAIVGVVVPIIGGSLYVSMATDVPWTVAFFQGGVFAATSVGITASIFTDLKVDKTGFARIIISAAVIDDLLGLMVLTLSKALNMDTVDHHELMLEIGAAVIFIGLIPFFGHKLIPRFVRSISRFDEEVREAIVLSFMLLYGAAAMTVHLAGIVGAYFAGVALEESYFKPKEHDNGNDHPVEHFIDNLITALAPVFFVYAVCIVDPMVFLNPMVLMHGVLFTVIAMIGKLACGLMVKRDRLIVGVGMSPRGEVGIVFATLGLQYNILTQDLFGASMIMVLATTMMTPWLLKRLIPRPDPTPALTA